MTATVPAAEAALAKAARGSNSSEALYRLGIMYSTGQGVPQDNVAAHKWFNLAAMAGHQEARTWRRQLADEMSAAEIADAQRQARAWLAGA
ncbi:MAG: SEL1-like repeat protein [Alphaproteobacteria bacterium]|nr:SEL1-like repeat protein [Alphaproteobacteria bacterium]